jgi:hypothetical protein
MKYLALKAEINMFYFSNIFYIMVFKFYLKYYLNTSLIRGHCSHDHIVVGFTTTYAISAYHH